MIATRIKIRNKNLIVFGFTRAQEHKFNICANLCTYIICSFVLFFFAGCNSGNLLEEQKAKIENLTSQNESLSSQLEKADAENKELKQQVSVLQKLPDNVKALNLYQIESVKITNYTALYDDNKDGKNENLIVRFQTIDNDGDIIKAAGSADVELWDLNKPQQEALIGKWQVGVEELKKDWTDFIVTNYRLTFDISDKLKSFDEPLTVKLTFTDYLSGKVFQVQKVIEP